MMENSTYNIVHQVLAVVVLFDLVAMIGGSILRMNLNLQ